MSNKQQAFAGGAFIHKELQGFAAFVAYQSCHHSGGSVTKAILEARIVNQYFGDANDPGSIGLAEQLVRGLGIFRSLYEQSSGSLDSYSTPIRNCDQHAVTNNPLSTVVNRSSLVMKPSLLCLGGHITIPVGGTNGITLPLLYQSKLTPPLLQATTTSSPEHSFLEHKKL